jgi:L-malate glycosyltransferase
MAAVKILHFHSTFDLGGKEARAVRLMNALGDQATHTIISAVPTGYGARAAVNPAIRVDYPALNKMPHPALAGPPALKRLRALTEYMQRFDLLLSYNWGALDAVMAHRLFARKLGLPPLIHHEDGFNADEIVKRKRTRDWYRRIALKSVSALVVPSVTLTQIATQAWGVADTRLHQIANGIAINNYGQPPALGLIAGLANGMPVIGTIAGLRAVKNLPLLVRAFARMEQRAQLVIVGDGPERATILAEADRLGVADRVILPGFLTDPARYIGAFDCFALSSDSEQQPIALLEAMAQGLPVVATAVGDVPTMVAPENRALIVAVADEAGLARGLDWLISNPAQARTIGLANQALARAAYDQQLMLAKYFALYGETIQHRFDFARNSETIAV